MLEAAAVESSPTTSVHFIHVDDCDGGIQGGIEEALVFGFENNFRRFGGGCGGGRSCAFLFFFLIFDPCFSFLHALCSAMDFAPLVAGEGVVDDVEGVLVSVEQVVVGGEIESCESFHEGACKSVGATEFGDVVYNLLGGLIVDGFDEVAFSDADAVTQ